MEHVPTESVTKTLAITIDGWENKGVRRGVSIENMTQLKPFYCRKQ